MYLFIVFSFIIFIVFSTAVKSAKYKPQQKDELLKSICHNVTQANLR